MDPVPPPPSVSITEAVHAAIVPQACTPGAPGEITVCAHRADPERYRLPVPSQSVRIAGPPVARWGIGNGATIGISAMQRSLPGGSAPAAMVTIKVPF